MQNADALAGNSRSDNSVYCLAKPGVVYVIYLPNGGSAELDLGEQEIKMNVRWFDPRLSCPLQDGTVNEVSGPGIVSLGEPPHDKNEDWVILVRKP